MNRTLFIALVCLGMLVSGLVHLFFPVATDKYMTRPRNVRIVGAILLVLVAPALAWGFYILALLCVLFGLPRFVTPDRSIDLQQRLYPRRVHGLILVMGAAGLWMAFKLLQR